MNTKAEKTFQINIIDVIKLIKNDKRKIMLYFAIAGILGIAIAFTTPKTYKSSVLLAPEESGASFSGSLSSIASMVGMNMNIGQTGDALYPEIYPDIVSSTDFLYKLFPIKIKNLKGDIDCDYYTYLSKHTKGALISYPILAINKLLNKMKQTSDINKNKAKCIKTPLWLTKEQDGIIGQLSTNILCSVDKKTNVISITVTDQDPLVAALIADSVKTHLQVAITEYQTKKACNDLTYMEQIYKEARQQYDKARLLYASYADANTDIMLESFKMKETDLENDMQLKYNIYTQVVEQLQLAKAKVQEHTPAFTTVQSAIVPLKPSSKPRLLIIITYAIFGSIIRICILAYKNKRIFLNI